MPLAWATILHPNLEFQPRFESSRTLAMPKWLTSHDDLRIGVSKAIFKRAAKGPQSNRPPTTEIIDHVTETFGLAQGEVFDRKHHKEAFHLLVYLLCRVRNLPLKQVAQLAGISPARVSQIAKEFDNPNRRCSLQTRGILKNYNFSVDNHLEGFSRMGSRVHYKEARNTVHRGGANGAIIRRDRFARQQQRDRVTR
jgi:hypothetical protein